MKRTIKKIAIAYVHDTSTSSSFSYGVSYGVASIGVTPSSSNVGYLNNIFSFIFISYYIHILLFLNTYI